MTEERCALRRNRLRNLLTTAKKVINIGQSVEAEEESLVWAYFLSRRSGSSEEFQINHST